MAFLRLYDYIATIQDAQLNQIIAGNSAVRLVAEKRAQDMAIEYLGQKYDIANFPDTTVYSFVKEYRAKSLIELNFPVYSATGTYVLNSLVINSGKAYINITPITVAEPFDVTKWLYLGTQYDLFNIPAPHPEFDVYSVYRVGDKVWWRDKVYQCKIETLILSHGDKIQYQDISSLPIQNVFPDNIVYGEKYWGVGYDYSFTGLTPVAAHADFTAWDTLTAYILGDRVSFEETIYQATNANTGVSPDSDISKWQVISWSAGDNRSFRLVEKLVYISIYNMLPRLSPNNRPRVYIDEYAAAKEWLIDVQNEVMPAKLQKIQPARGQRILSGGNNADVTSY